MNVAGVKRMSHVSVRRRLAAEHLARVDAQRMTVRCADCRWYYQGLVGDAKRAFAAHRERRHS